MDRIIDETNFNVAKLQYLRGRQHEFMRETHDIAEHVKAGLELSPEQEKRLKHLDTKNEIIYGILDMMLEPVYLKMRELGYSHEDLIR